MVKFQFFCICASGKSRAIVYPMKATKSHFPFQTFANALKTFAKAYFRTPFGCALYAEYYARERGSTC